MQIAQKTIVVTGAGSGIGRELSIQLLQKGAKIAGLDIDADTLNETQQLAGVGDERFKAFQVDISDKERVETLAINIVQHFGSVDGLINNAGIIQPFKKVNELSYEAIDRVWKVNVNGTLFLTKALLPHFLNRPEAHIVNISSMGGFLPVPGQTIYGASKAAVKLIAEGLYAELKNTNVHVTVIFPRSSCYEYYRKFRFSYTLNLMAIHHSRPFQPQRLLKRLFGLLKRINSGQPWEEIPVFWIFYTG